MVPVLGYWNIRGLAQPIRFMLAYTETPFVDKQYAFGPAPDYNRSAWLKEKFILGLDFPNLPYYIEDNIKITQSISIMHYLARKHKLAPETEEEKMKADMIEQQIVDIWGALAKLCYSPDFKKLKDDYVKNLPNVLEPVSKYLGVRNFFASQDKLTYVDFLVYEVLDNHKDLVPECLDDFQNLKDFTQRIEELPTIKKYMQSDDFIKYPFMGDEAVFCARDSKV